jgi:protein-S-isoprenylcysteine O-methyltransferase Ste14
MFTVTSMPLGSWSVSIGPVIRLSATWSARHPPSPDRRQEAWTGLGLVIAGAAIAVWARALLGSNWSATVTLKRGHELVRRGPYALVRHPIYSGLLLGVLGTALALGEVRGIVAFAVAFIDWGIKSATEERFLVDQFYGSYVRYRAEVKRLIPFVC